MPAPRGRIHEKLVRAAGRAAAKETHRRDLARQTTPEQLGRSVREYLGATRIIIASKSEPYQHVRRNGTIESLRSPGGLASALDSVARATALCVPVERNPKATFSNALRLGNSRCS